MVSNIIALKGQAFWQVNLLLLSLEQLVEINPDIMVYMREDIDKTIYKEWKDTELYKSLKAIQNGDVYTTIARGPWTQYRGFISINTLTKEMSQWLLDNN